MPANKNALTRYLALDKCLSDDSKKYFIKDLLAACNKALWDFDGIEGGISRRTLYDDLHRMEMDYGAPIESGKVGRNVYYFYERSFSISNQPLNKKEARILTNAISTLQRFKGMPQFEWINEVSARLEIEFQLNNVTDKIVSFEDNPYLKGMEFYSPIFDAISYKQVIKVKYSPFHKAPITFIIHPYLLKQYNNRWFLFGLNDGHENITNIPLDRINKIETTKKKYIPNRIANLDEYFEDIVGVSIPKDGNPQKILLEVDNNLFPYIENKPIHGSQRIIERGEVVSKIEIEVIPNYELRALILSYGDGIEVISPIGLRNDFKAIFERLLKKYSMCENSLHTSLIPLQTKFKV